MPGRSFYHPFTNLSADVHSPEGETNLLEDPVADFVANPSFYLLAHRLDDLLDDPHYSSHNAPEPASLHSFEHTGGCS